MLSINLKAGGNLWNFEKRRGHVLSVVYRLGLKVFLAVTVGLEVRHCNNNRNALISAIDIPSGHSIPISTIDRGLFGLGLLMIIASEHLKGALGKSTRRTLSIQFPGSGIETHLSSLQVALRMNLKVYKFQPFLLYLFI